MRQVAYPLTGHNFNPLKDIVVITGGSNGLGKELVRLLKMRNARVAILDVVPLEEATADSNVRFYECDVSDVNQLLACHDQILKDFGAPTILINNAGVNTAGTILETSFSAIENVIKINLLLSFYTTKIFLPEMLERKRGYIVTISSVLGYLSPTHFGAYGASKSGLMAFHESLTYEMGCPLLSTSGIKTLLVCPGQMDTEMFLNVRTPLNMLAPKLSLEAVAAKIIRALETGARGELRLPLYTKLVPLLRAAPCCVVGLFRFVSQMDNLAKQSVEAQRASPLNQIRGTEKLFPQVNIAVPITINPELAVPATPDIKTGAASSTAVGNPTASR
ncbi:NAD(P)-binding protein [Metschnikowia bicuspidata]|uniref:NAD(P)-binding protein n=1 Tax=Metschnikowia bicuspidata TaxID=27322 RepID=A0A4P9ZD82_9ASCO|nr:NAD(P)-binding protein [Metschnikowia bicuspidata]